MPTNIEAKALTIRSPMFTFPNKITRIMPVPNSTIRTNIPLAKLQNNSSKVNQYIPSFPTLPFDER